MTGAEKSGGASMETQLHGFLTDWTAPLLSVEEQKELLHLFGQVSEECLSGASSVDPSGSDLNSGGVPPEFSCVVDRMGAGSVRFFIVDSQPEPRSTSQARKVIRRHADLVVPRSVSSSELTDRLLDRHLAEVPDFSRPYVGYGARFAPGKSRAGRIYFNTCWMSSWTVYRLLSEFVENEGLRLFRSSYIGQEQPQGVAYDFDDRGLARVKVYVWVGVAPKDAGPALATKLPGLRRAPLDELVALVTETRGDTKSVPPVLVGVGFAPRGDYCDLKVCFPADSWGWETFHSLQPILSAVLGHWGLSADLRPTARPREKPWSHFAPTWVSLDVSPRGESLSVYFQPITMPVRGRERLLPRQARSSDFQAGDPRTAFGTMFSQLLGTEAWSRRVPRVGQG